MTRDTSRTGWHGLCAVALFTAIYMMLAGALALGRGNLEFVFYVAVLLLLIVTVAVVHRRVRLELAALWALSLWGLAHMAGGLLVVPASWPTAGESSVLYSLWLIPDRLKYDHIVHAYGFGVTTWVCWQALRSMLYGTGSSPVIRPSFGMLVLCVAAALGFGALNEVVEFAATLLVPETNVGGYVNTGWDLVANLVGAVIAACWIATRYRRGQGV